MRSFLPAATLALSALLAPVQSLYFYIEGTNPKCFFEELPKDTLVVGHYSAEEFSIDRNAYVRNDALQIFISVDVRKNCVNCSCEHFNNAYLRVDRKSSTTIIA